MGEDSLVPRLSAHALKRQLLTSHTYYGILWNTMEFMGMRLGLQDPCPAGMDVITTRGSALTTNECLAVAIVGKS